MPVSQMLRPSPEKVSRFVWVRAASIACTLVSMTLGMTACVHQKTSKAELPSYYGTLEPMASDAVYFLMTDRFVNGDKSNDFVEQGGKYPTYRRELKGPKGQSAFVGYMGGDFKGILQSAAYIADMGFGAIWLTPIVDQPDEAFSGGEPIDFGGAFKDGGKTGYHGYWGVNFFKVDEHLPSPDLSFAQLTRKLKNEHGIKTVLDIVLNHGSPAFSMPEQRDRFGKVLDKDGKLVADHQNIKPEMLDANNPLHQFFNQKPDILQLADFNPESERVLDYFVEAYLHWIEQGADAFRIDTIKHMPHEFWKKFTDRIRAVHPKFFMFAESYSFEPEFIAQHTLVENGAVSVLDFPGRKALLKVFGNLESDFDIAAAGFEYLQDYLFLEGAPYQNPYNLMTFYDNHDMSRMAANEDGFIDAHNWLFTSRGIPVIYYGSEIGFMAGAKEHAGNRNYFGNKGIAKARSNRIFMNLKRIATLRKSLVALQRGLQVNLFLEGERAAFLRVYQHSGEAQTALVLLNKSDRAQSFEVDSLLSHGLWKSLVDHSLISVDSGGSIQRDVEAHSFDILVFEQAVNNDSLKKILTRRMLEGQNTD
ncbi:alpha-amylase family glycosyl hydrolase [Aliikangiella sp. G2MR2-5]|uniref:alpha-amylase family glycosyl hydrolase n=1 Tax=Aliikangiella sp. G2MR2-5 TaxID=2788943 RepID=UPI001AED25A4|nr:alpha-amylase family glycosyl hydrolase [Aliikangiella sp. G2MR2-5]